MIFVTLLMFVPLPMVFCIGFDSEEKLNYAPMYPPLYQQYYHPSAYHNYQQKNRDPDAYHQLDNKNFLENNPIFWRLFRPLPVATSINYSLNAPSMPAEPKDSKEELLYHPHLFRPIILPYPILLTHKKQCGKKYVDNPTDNYLNIVYKKLLPAQNITYENDKGDEMVEDYDDEFVPTTRSLSMASAIFGQKPASINSEYEYEFGTPRGFLSNKFSQLSSHQSNIYAADSDLITVPVKLGTARTEENVLAENLVTAPVELGTHRTGESVLMEDLITVPAELRTDQTVNTFLKKFNDRWFSTQGLYEKTTIPDTTQAMLN